MKNNNFYSYQGDFPNLIIKENKIIFLNLMLLCCLLNKCNKFVIMEMEIIVKICL